jgi:phage terminase large subunit-like protein
MVATSEEIRIKPQAGPQMAFARSNADIAIYGGAAGGGKSWALMFEPLRHIHRPGFNGVIFRRTMEQVKQSGGLWDESYKLYGTVQGVPRLQSRSWLFQPKAKIGFAHLEHEATKLNYQGAQIAYEGFDEITHFSESQFFYLLSRNRTLCGIRPYVRATCNPEPGWVANLLEWWIDQETGYAIPDRCGQLRYFYRSEDHLHFYDSSEEAKDNHPLLADKIEPKSLTFVSAKLSDNAILQKADPGYLANLMALPRVERARLLDGNWKISGKEIIDLADIQSYDLNGDGFRRLGTDHQWRHFDMLRFATIDTAGTSREKAESAKGKSASYSVCAIWDYEYTHDLLFLRRVWRKQCEYSELRQSVSDFLREHHTRQVYLENAHFGPALASDLGTSFAVSLIPTKISGMADTFRGAKYERAIASGLLARIENGKLYTPRRSDAAWVEAYLGELQAWDGLPDSMADQIDVSSHACYAVKSQQIGTWGGIVR